MFLPGRVHIKTLFMLLIVFLMACKKNEQVSQKDNVNDSNYVNGYLYSSYSVSTNSYVIKQFYASFSDPARNLSANYDHRADQNLNQIDCMGNIEVGYVSFYTKTVLSATTFSNHIFYSYKKSLFNDYPYNPYAQWSVSGNGSFRNFQVTPDISSTFIDPDMIIDSISLATGLGINDTLISNYDSLVVIVSDNAGTTSKVSKCFARNSKPVFLNSVDLQSLKPVAKGILSIYGYTYLFQTIDDKKYLFEMSNKINRYVKLVP